MDQRIVNTVELVHAGGLRFDARDPRNSTAILDSGPPEGEGAGMSPMEFLLAGLGACTAMDVIGILRKKRQEVTDYRVEVAGERANQHPREFTSISIRHIVTGRNVNDAAVRQAIGLSEEKYCSAYATLRKAVPISTTYEVRATETESGLP